MTLWINNSIPFDLIDDEIAHFLLRALFNGHRSKTNNCVDKTHYSFIFQISTIQYRHPIKSLLCLLKSVPLGYRLIAGSQRTNPEYNPASLTLSVANNDLGVGNHYLPFYLWFREPVNAIDLFGANIPRSVGHLDRF